MVEAVIVPDPPNDTVTPLNVTALLVRLEFAMLVKVLLDPLIDLLVNVCDPVRVATVESIAIVTGDDPLNDPPDSPVPIVSVFVVTEEIVPDPPNEIVVPLTVSELLAN